MTGLTRRFVGVLSLVLGVVLLLSVAGRGHAEQQPWQGGAAQPVAPPPPASYDPRTAPYHGQTPYGARGGERSYGAQGQRYPAGGYGAPRTPPRAAPSAPAYGQQAAPGYLPPGQSPPPAPGYRAPRTYGQSQGAPAQQGYGQPQRAPGYRAPGYQGYQNRPPASQPYGNAYQAPGGYQGQPPQEDGRPAYGARPPYGETVPGQPSAERYGRAAHPMDEQTYSANEIIDAGHRFFGKVSGGIAKAIESVFKKQGRPNAYILGEEAGGSFFAGLRYGEGKIYTKWGEVRKVYWQGPSFGYDFGATGAKTMILVYNLRDVGQIYQRFGAVDGQAYLVGGVGVTLEGKGDVKLARIQSGVGVRFGANVGYIKYSRRPTWNPF